MRIAVLSDVHGNLPALDAVLAAVEDEGFDAVVSGGDVVTGPMPAACLERLARLGDRVAWVRGNADREVLELLAGTLEEDPHGPVARQAAWAAARLSAEDRELLAAFAATVRLGEVLVCHGTPASDTGIVTPRARPRRLSAAVGDTDAAIVVGGHVHLQFVQRAGSVQWVNAGSVGMPYEGASGAFWLAIVDGSIDLRRTAYDTAAAAAAIRATGYPDADDQIAAITGAITREEAMDAFDPHP
ncbi:MAG TPA: YfcE family phosphodiesterase [Baekduia sp.]|nr:YfcE family phosphodiesterase [Baekduia sp.]